MPIPYTCPECSSRFALADQLAGKKARCKKCQAVFVVPHGDQDDPDDDASDTASKPRAPARSGTAKRVAEPAGRKSPASRHRDEDEDRPTRRRQHEDDDDEEDRPARRKRDEDRPGRKRKDTGSSVNVPLLIGMSVGCLLLLAGGIVGGIYLLNPRSSPDKQEASNTQPATNVPNGVPPGGVVALPGQGPAGLVLPGRGLPGQGLPGQNPAGPNPPVKNPPLENPVTTTPVENPVEKAPAGDDTKRGNGTLAREAKAAVKRATVFLKVTMANGIASGTGFFGDADSPNILLTNAHVVGMLSPDSPKPLRIEVTINSGESDEKKTTATVLGVDRLSDLAVLKIVPVAGLPKPLTVVKSANHLELLDNVWVAGFPLGEELGKEITIRPSSVSSLRKKGGVLEKIQVNGGMDPGNSGGPVVDDLGRVVGVAVSGIPGRAINFAIPGDRVYGILNGRLSALGAGLPFKEDDKISVPITMEMIDPRDKIKETAVEVWSGDAPPRDKPARPPAISTPPKLPGDSAHVRSGMTYANGIGKGEMVLPPLPDGKVWWMQALWVNTAGETRWASANVYRLPSAPLERKAVALQMRYLTGIPARRVGLTIHTSSRVGADEEGELAAEDTQASFTESVQSTGATGTTLSLAYAGVEQKRVLGRMVIPGLSPLVRNQLRKASARIQVDAAGRITSNTLAADLRGLTVQARKELQDFHEPIRTSLEAMMLPLPGETVTVGKAWTAKREIAVAVPAAGLKKLTLDMTCTYRGTRTQNGRQEAIVFVEGTTRGDGAGKVSGMMVFDVAAGAIKQVQLTLKLELAAIGMNIAEGKVQKINIQSNVTISLDRAI